MIQSEYRPMCSPNKTVEKPWAKMKMHHISYFVTIGVSDNEYNDNEYLFYN